MDPALVSGSDPRGSPFSSGSIPSKGTVRWTFPHPSPSRWIEHDPRDDEGGIGPGSFFSVRFRHVSANGSGSRLPCSCLPSLRTASKRTPRRASQDLGRTVLYMPRLRTKLCRKICVTNLVRRLAKETKPTTNLPAIGIPPGRAGTEKDKWFSRRLMATGTGSMSTEIDPVLRSMHDAIPLLETTKHKGQCGKIAVVGGCEEYTGAPYFAAMTALFAGADLSHVFCGRSASGVIKGYSPDLIVHPYLPDDTHSEYGGHDLTDEELEAVSTHCANRVAKWMPKFDCLIVGPGMGRSKAMLATVSKVIKSARGANIPIVVDADGLFLLTKDLALVSGYDKAILTPNVVELQRLANSAGLAHESAEDTAQNLSQELGGITILSKGSTDFVCCGKSSLTCKEVGSPRRAGGQGDVLAGFVGLFSAWVHSSSADLSHAPPTLIASYSACVLAREASRLAYARLGRSLTAFEVTKEVGRAMQNIWGNLP